MIPPWENPVVYEIEGTSPAARVEELVRRLQME